MADPAKRPERTAEELEYERGEVYKNFLDHLMEMRARIVLSLCIIVVTTSLAWTFFDRINAVLLEPLRKVHESMTASGELPRAYAGLYPPQTFAVHEAFVYVLKMGLVAGLVLASPFLVYELWAFVSPGLKRRERMALIPIFWMGLGFFLLGAAVCYAWVLPAAIRYFVLINVWVGSELRTRLNEYVDFVIGLELAFGISFELPLVMMALARLGVVSPQAMVDKWRYVVVGAFVVGAVLTPPDCLSQIMLASCLLVLYAIGIGLSYAFCRPESGDSG